MDIKYTTATELRVTNRAWPLPRKINVHGTEYIRVESGPRFVIYENCETGLPFESPIVSILLVENK